MLSKRLSACASLIRPHIRVCDVGTDHAYLPCFLAQTGKWNQIIASDVNEKPLLSAQKHIFELGFSDRIRTLRSDGLEQISAEDADDIVIAGMGGELMIQIIDSCPWAKDSQKHFILQPMTNAEKLRIWLCQNGFEIKREIPVSENRHFYTAMLCVYSGKAEEPDELFSIVGKVPDEESQDRNAYLQYQSERMKKIACGLQQAKQSLEDPKHYLDLAQNISALMKTNSKDCKNVL
jgi:tRNA (adenine22-N1)-methyltransferase